ncbi:MAG: hypothetical protein K6E90_08915, partial [Lachnospiraceae bacterium]|nr:hypothetical protein [Lachnospiraceae bacterium]
SAATVFNVLEQYLNNPGSAAAANVSAVNVAQAAEELMRFQQASEQASEPEILQEIEPVTGSLVHRKEERLSEEDITEILDTYQSRETRGQRVSESVQEITDNRSINTTTVTQNTDRRLTATELDNIEDMVNRGVRSQMGAISDQVLRKLEKRLSNEKSRRGL